MRSPHIYNFAAGERVLGAEPQSGAEREMHYYVNDDAVSKLLGSRLGAVLADLVDVAAAIHIADRLAVREHGSPEGWKRHFRIQVPVRCLSDWRRNEVEESLGDVLSFLTADEWDVQFSSRPARPRFSEQQGCLFPVDPTEPIRVNLFSGGLDSFAGNIAALAENPEVHYVCVSATQSYRQESHQKDQVRSLRIRPYRSLTHVRIPCWLESASEVPQEPTRRTRGLLFLALGAVTALNAGTDHLYLYENGVGAINLPYERTPVGLPNSRSVHPRTLLLVSHFMQALTGRQFRIENPCVFQTKAEMCAHPAVQLMASSIPTTFSCDGFPVQRSGLPQCGLCTSCILRRLALENSGLHGVDGEGYACDLYNANQTITRRRLRGLAAMDWQVERLRQALTGGAGWRTLMAEFPELRRICVALVEEVGDTHEVIQNRLERLYRRHCDEWKNFPPRQWMLPQRKAA
jgi:7-cyano-7-deazaguanine synthase in queuosine biosynthesis